MKEQVITRNLKKWILLSIVVGITIGFASTVFLYALKFVTTTRIYNSWLLYLLPLAGILIVYLYKRFGSDLEAGNNLLIDEISKPTKKIPFVLTPLIFFTTLLTHLFGGSAGREGTALQMAGGIADSFSKPFKLTNQDRAIILQVAIAAGFGSIFGTPLTGILFSIELLLVRKKSLQAIIPVIIATFIAHYFALLLQAPHASYKVYWVPEMSRDMILYAVEAGILFGLCARLFKNLMQRCKALFGKIKNEYIRIAIGAIIFIGMVTLLGTNKYLGLGLPEIFRSFNYKMDYYEFAIKMLLTVLTLSIGFKGGEVTPLFYIGAALGSTLSIFLPIPTSLLAAMGFVGVFAGATNTPLACTVMALELFGIECGFFVFISCFMSYFVSGQTSIYPSQLRGNQKFWFSNR